MLRVSQDAFHGPLCGSLHDLLDVLILGLQPPKQTGKKSASEIVSIGQPDGTRTWAASLTGFSRRTVRSTTDTLGVGTRKAMPVSLLWGGAFRDGFAY